MAQRVNVVVLCDIDEVEGATGTSFAFRGNSYEIDLCDVHLREMEEALTPYTLSGRRIGRARRTTVPAPTPAPAATRSNGHASGADGREVRDAVRQWALEQGYEIGMRGRISQDIYNAYNESHS